LSLRGCQMLTPSTLARRLPLFTALKTLDLALTQTDDDVLRALTNLNELDISYCRAVTRAGIDAVLARNPTLNTLSLHACDKLSLHINMIETACTERRISLRALFIARRIGKSDEAAVTADDWSD